MSSRIEQTIDDIIEYLDGCKVIPFSNNERISVNKDEIYELLQELKSKTPEEIKLYQKMIVNRDTILENAKNQGNEIIARAQEYSDQMVNEHEIMQQAYAQAAEVVNQARTQAQNILDSAMSDANNYQMQAVEYTDSSLGNLQDILNHTINAATSRYDDLLSSLNECMDIVNANRAQLSQPDVSSMTGDIDYSDEDTKFENEAEKDDGNIPERPRSVKNSGDVDII